jgi:cell wall-associated NlpC family hydrolase
MEIRKLATSYKEAIVAAAVERIGSLSMRYVTGRPDLGQSKEHGYDCSGFVRQVLLHAGLHIPDYIGMDDERRPIRHASEFWDHYGIHASSEPEAGDLIFFSRHGLMPTHIGIVRDEESYIHAPGQDNTEVTIDTITHQDITPRQIGSRVLYQVNPIGFKAPTIPLPTPTYRYHQQLA